MLVDDARWILAAWRDRFIDDDDVRTWVLTELESTPAADLPEWLLDLCTNGVADCMRKPSGDFLDVPFLDFSPALALHVRTCDLADRDEVDALVAWISHACMGENLDRPGVRLGYLLDHDLNDCGRPDWARDLLTKQLPDLQSDLELVPETIVNVVRQSSLRRRGLTPSS